MTLKALQTSSGKFTIAAFDQRASLAKMLGVDPSIDSGKTRLIQLKKVFMESFSPICSSVLVDPDFGLPSLRKLSDNAGLLLSLEQASYSIEDKNAVPQLSEYWTVEEIAKHNAAVKFVLFYHPESENAATKRELVQKIFGDCKSAGVPFLFEVILHPLGKQTDAELAKNHPQLQLQTVRDFTDKCNVLKLEFPLLPTETLDEETAAIACRTISSTATVPWIILSKGMSYERFIIALDIAMKSGAAGFACGRAVWKEIAELPTLEEQDTFIRTTAKERMQQLIDVVEA
jgi:tagatose 1,6-diphosphate aldolase